jgi:HEPN domain-containing protein
MNTRVAEWLRQAEYMFQGGRRFYSVFMCHLAVEKGLKALFEARLNRLPPKTHNLVYLASQSGVQPEAEIGAFIVKLGEASVPTRYPDSIEQLQKEYTSEVTKGILAQAKATLQWIKKQL